MLVLKNDEHGCIFFYFPHICSAIWGTHDDVIKWKQFPPRHWPLCGEFTDHRWIPLTKANAAELLMFSLICSCINGKQWRGWRFETPSRPLWRYWNEALFFSECRYLTYVALFTDYTKGVDFIKYHVPRMINGIHCRVRLTQYIRLECSYKSCDYWKSLNHLAYTDNVTLRHGEVA